MWNKIKSTHHTFGLMLFIVVMVGSSVRAGQASQSTYRLSRNGYSPVTNTLLLAWYSNFDEPLMQGGGLTAYNEKTDSIIFISSLTGPGPFDFAWVPDQAAFVITQGDRMILYEKDAHSDGYSGTSIRCPIDFFYTSCSSSPDGKCLAVTCLDLKNSGRILGLYEFKEQKFMTIKLDIDHRFVVWGDDGLLYATSHDKILAVELKDKKPRIVRTIPLKERLIIFYGMFGKSHLFQTYEGIILGDKKLIELDQPAKFRVAATKTAIFVSASPKELAVFDHTCQQLDRTNPGKLIRFGSVKDQNSVYALADSTLLRVSVENQTINIHTVCDLDDAQLLLPK